ncbi:pyruvate kinase [Methylopila musalis]|uniref:Pyruvate kinase n=1 Tax=Methylopila musalis TaxID=1134781 RepID=A0ABW3Z977_9HYPH
MRRLRRVKVLATLGPSSSTPEMVEKLFRAGADVFRINMSHTSHERMRELVQTIRDVEDEVARPIGILIDLQGPKLRVGRFTDGAALLKQGATFTLDADPTPGDETRVHLPHPEILEALEPGHTLLLDDGKIRLVARACTPTATVADVIVGGRLSDRKGVSLPDTLIKTSAMTPKDHSDLEAALATDSVDWIALSFVQRPEDITEAKDIIQGRAGVMTKIEKPQAMTRLQEIVDLSDSVMVARGDLGVEMPLEVVPGLQKQMTRACRKAGKPVIIATQMLESMITQPTPTRAEVSDVATAVFEGADAIMLSAESAAGAYPVEAVAMMNSIALNVEHDPYYRSIIDAQRAEPEATGADAISAAARQIAETLDLASIICWTAYGTTARRAARERPKQPIIALTPSLPTSRRLALVWGVHSVLTHDAHDLDDIVNRACDIALDQGLATEADRVIISAGVPLRQPGATNMLRIAYVGGDHLKRD